jgi:hypothetical protein
MMVRGPSERVSVDFRTFRTDRNDDSKWQVVVSHCCLIHLYGSQTLGLAITNNTFAEGPHQNLSVLGYLPGSQEQDAFSYVGQKLTLKRLNANTVGILIRQRLHKVGEIDLQLRTAVHFSSLADNDATEYVICLTFYQIPDEYLPSLTHLER